MSAVLAYLVLVFVVVTQVDTGFRGYLLHCIRVLVLLD